MTTTLPTDTDDTARFDASDLAFLSAQAYIMAHEAELDAALTDGVPIAHVIKAAHVLLTTSESEAEQKRYKAQIVAAVGSWKRRDGQ